MEIKPAITECRDETLPLNHPSTSHISDIKSTSNGNCAANQRKCVLKVISKLFTEDTVTSRAPSSQEDGKYAPA